MVRPGHPLDFDWRRISRWCCLGTIVMVVWLLVPVARCSFTTFRDTPLGEVAEDKAPADADRDRVSQGQGFFETWLGSTKRCYERTPLLGQEPWKKYLLLSFGGMTLVAWLIARIMARRRRTYT